MNLNHYLNLAYDRMYLWKSNARWVNDSFESRRPLLAHRTAMNCRTCRTVGRRLYIEPIGSGGVALRNGISLRVRVYIRPAGNRRRSGPMVPKTVADPHRG